MTHSTTHLRRILLAMACGLALAACGSERLDDPVEDGAVDEAGTGGTDGTGGSGDGSGGSAEIDETTGGSIGFPGADGTPPTPTMVETAKLRFPNAGELHAKVIERTCTPNEGVCHNQKEYPDMHTVGNFLETIEAPCNLAPADRSSIYDRCERPGDRFKFNDRDFSAKEIGWIEIVEGQHVDYAATGTTPTVDSPGIHIKLAERVSFDASRTNVYGPGLFTRHYVASDGQVDPVPYATFETRWWFLDGGTHVFGELRSFAMEQEAKRIVEMDVVEGDPNQNGTFGAAHHDPMAMIEPGNPEESYLIGRMRGEMLGETVPGTAMPLANQPLNETEWLALLCFIEGLEPGVEPSSVTPIDYDACTYVDDGHGIPDDGGEGFAAVTSILTNNCAGCHGEDNPQQGLSLVGDGLYDNLMETSTQNPAMKLVEPGSPEQSYLWAKLTGGEAMTGQQMPLDGAGGSRQLPQADLDAIHDWIASGAPRE